MLLRSLYQLNRRPCKLIIVEFNLSAVWQKIIEMYKYQFHFFMLHVMFLLLLCFETKKSQQILLLFLVL